MQLPTRPLGRTGLRPTRLGLGLAALGRPGYINLGHSDDVGADKSVTAMRARCYQVLDAAWAAGIRYFDAARSYGRAEEFLALWMDRRGYHPVVGSKWGYTYTADWQVQAAVHEVKEHSRDRLDEQWRLSWRTLGERLALYQIHSATLQSGVLDNAAVLKRLVELKESGTRIGLSLSGPGQAETLERAVEQRVDGTRVFDTVQATWNLLEPSAGVALAAARKLGVGVLVKESLANGRLTARNPSPELDPLEAVAEQHHATLDAVAVAAALAQPWADVVLLGAATLDQLSSNLAAASLALDADALNRLTVLAEPPEDYWSRRARLAWN